MNEMQIQRSAIEIKMQKNQKYAEAHFISVEKKPSE